MVATPTSLLGLDALRIAQETQPLVTLTVYPHAVVLQKPGQTEYAVDPDALAKLFQTDTRHSTGLLHPDTLLVEELGAERTVVGYRAPQPTAIWLEGSDSPAVVPLPGLVMLRTGGKYATNHKVFAVKERPASLDAPLYHAPLPNVGERMGVCWGSVARHVSPQSNDLTPDWDAFFGTTFGNHNVKGKSHAHRDDIRKALLAYDQRESWPLDDLVPVNITLAQAVR